MATSLLMTGGIGNIVRITTDHAFTHNAPLKDVKSDTVLKGTVQRKLRGVQNGINRKVLL